MLDAMEDAPQLYAVLTARNHLSRRDTYRALEQVRRACRRRWPHVRWATIPEFQRRGALHLNLLVKGVPVEAEREFHAVLARVWCARPEVDAVPAAQFVGTVYEGGGLVRYFSLHFLKESQAPPIGWRGQRVTYSRDYLVRPAGELRAEARRSLQVKRLIWRGMDAAAAELEVAAREQEVWRLHGVNPNTAGLLAVPGEGLSEIEREELLLAAAQREFTLDPIERLAALSVAVQREYYWQEGEA